MFHPTLYKIDSMNRVRTWCIESNEISYRTHSGLIDGKIVVSGWQYPTEKNIGKINATSVSEQVLAEVASKYERQTYQGKYAPSIEEAKKGAKFVECMLASKYDPKKDNNFPYWSQPKFDGIRALVSDSGMQSRNGKPLVSSPHINDILETFFAEFPGVILDGELYNHDLKYDFEKIISLARKTKPTAEDIEESSKLIELHVYDVIFTDLTYNYDERYRFLTETIKNRFSMIKVVSSVLVDTSEHVEQKLGEYLEDGYEGQMLRDRSAVYEHKRSKFLLKHKTFEDAEFKIVDVLEGKGNYSGYAKSLVIELENGETQQCGMRGNFAYLKEVLDNKDKYIGTEATVVYQNRTSDEKLRFPVAKVLWKGKRDV